MSISPRPSSTPVPLGEKIAYGSGTLTLNLLPAALGVFSAFLIIEFGMDPLLAGLLGALPRMLDAVTDPIMGFITDNTRSRWGRRRPYVFVGAILSGLIFAFLWQLDPGNSQTYNFWYFLLLSLLFTLGNTMFATPLVGLGYEMASDYKERTHLMAFAQFAGQFAWMFVPWLWVWVANDNWFENAAEGVRQLAIWVAVACTLMGVLPAVFCKGIPSSHIENTKEISFRSLSANLVDVFRGICQSFRNVPFVRLCAATFLIFNGFQLVASFAFFIILYHMFGGDYGAAGNWPAWFGTISAVVTAFLVIPVVSWMADRWGKRNAFLISTCISIVGYILKWWGFNPENPWMIFLPIPFISFGIGGLFTLMMSMTADVCDLDELRNGMPRKEGTFGAIYWLMVKLGQALAIFLGGLVLKLVGFEGGAETQTAETMTQLRIADIIIPAVTAGIAIFVMLGYDLTEQRAQDIKAKLVQRRGEL
jgi:GPH family glycoside/pentoside/hexuronide:cation symporter